MVKANIEIDGKNVQNNIEIEGSSIEVILELSLILMRIKAYDNKVYRDILNSMEIINNSIEDGVDIDELSDMFISSYLETLKKGSK